MKKGLLTGLVLVLLLTMLLPAAPALAAKPADMQAGGDITAISPGVVGENVFAAGNSGRWRVTERYIAGEFTSGPFEGGLTIRYAANVDATQAGNFHGELIIGDDTCAGRINGRITPEFDPSSGLPPQLNVSGHWTVNEGAHGSGVFEATIYFFPLDDHVVAVLPGSTFTMSGKLK